MQKSVVRLSDGLVINRIEIHKDSKWTPPDGCILMDNGYIGQTWNGKEFVDPEPLPEPEPPRDILAEIDELKLKMNKVESDINSLKSTPSIK